LIDDLPFGPFSYRQAEADCTSAIDLDPKVGLLFLGWGVLGFYRMIWNARYPNVFTI